MNVKRFETWRKMYLYPRDSSFCEDRSFWEAWNTCNYPTWMLWALEVLGYHHEEELRPFGYFLTDLVAEHTPEGSKESLRLHQEAFEGDDYHQNIQKQHKDAMELASAVRKLHAPSDLMLNRPSAEYTCARLVELVIEAGRMERYRPADLCQCVDLVLNVHDNLLHTNNLEAEIAEHLRESILRKALASLLPRDKAQINFPAWILERQAAEGPSMDIAMDALQIAEGWKKEDQECLRGYTAVEAALSLWEQYGVEYR